MSTTSSWALSKITLNPLISLCRVMDLVGGLCSSCPPCSLWHPNRGDNWCCWTLGTLFHNLLRHYVIRLSWIPLISIHVPVLQFFAFLLARCPGDFTPPEPSHWHSHCSSPPLCFSLFSYRWKLAPPSVTSHSTWACCSNAWFSSWRQITRWETLGAEMNILCERTFNF